MLDKLQHADWGVVNLDGIYGRCGNMGGVVTWDQSRRHFVHHSQMSYESLMLRAAQRY